MFDICPNFKIRLEKSKRKNRFKFFETSCIFGKWTEEPILDTFEYFCHGRKISTQITWPIEEILSGFERRKEKVLKIFRALSKENPIHF